MSNRIDADRTETGNEINEQRNDGETELRFEDATSVDEFIDMMNDRQIYILLARILAKRFKYRRRSLVILSDDLDIEKHLDMQQDVIDKTEYALMALDELITEGFEDFDPEKDYSWDCLNIMCIREREPGELLDPSRLH